MTGPEVGSVEWSIRRAWDARDMDAATTEALRAYGAEVLGLLVGLHRDEDAAGDVFSSFSERLWHTFDRFEWKCTVRTWCYLLARRASHDHHRRGRRRLVPLSRATAISEIVARVRSETSPYLRTEAKSEIAKLREELPPEDRMLLILRVDRELSWDELARVFLGGDGENPTAEELKRESARLRKRFQLVKERLLRLGRQRGLFEE